MIPVINKKITKLISILGVILFFTPKINLISIQENESAGIRVDDILIGLMFAFLLCGFLLLKRNTISRIEANFALLILSFFISNIVNICLWKQSNILYSIRYIEYFCFFYVGYYYSQRFEIIKVIFWMLLINGIVMILQQLNLIGGFASAGFQSDASERAIGLTGGPWEIGTIINFIFAIYLFGQNKVSKIQINVIFLVTLSLILISGARMPTLAHLFLFLIYKYSKSQNKLIFSLSVSIYILLIILLILLIPNPVTERSSNLFTLDNIDQFFNGYNQIQVSNPFQGFTETLDANASGDASWLMRVSKWSYAIKSFTSSPYAWIIGVGPGLWGLALDGGWVRLLTESGIAGTLLFLTLFKNAAKLGKPVMGVIFALYINMIMIDIHISYKAMAFVFFVIGYYYQKKVSTKTTVQQSDI